jgi:hypothetical protein
LHSLANVELKEPNVAPIGVASPQQDAAVKIVQRTC